MNKINYNENEKYFQLNGKNHPKIYQAISLGENSIGIYNIFDVRHQILSATPVDEVLVNGQSFTSKEEIIEILIPILFDNLGTDVRENLIENKQKIDQFTSQITDAQDVILKGKSGMVFTTRGHFSTAYGALSASEKDAIQNIQVKIYEEGIRNGYYAIKNGETNNLEFVSPLKQYIYGKVKISNGFSGVETNLGYITSGGGISGLGTDNNWTHTVFLKVSEGDVISYTDLLSQISTTYSIACYDKKRIFQPSKSLSGNSSRHSGNFTIQSGVEWVIIMTANPISTANFSGNFGVPESSKANILEGNVQDVNSKLDTAQTDINELKQFAQSQSVISFSNSTQGNFVYDSGGAATDYDFLDQSNNTAKSLKIRPETEGVPEGDVYYLQWLDTDLVEQIDFEIYTNNWFAFARDSQHVYIISTTGQLYKILIATGSGSNESSRVSLRESISRNKTSSDSEIRINKTEYGCDIIFSQTSELWAKINFNQAGILITVASVVHASNLSSRWDAENISYSIAGETGKTLDVDSVPEANDAPFLFGGDPNSSIGILKFSKAKAKELLSNYNRFEGKKILLYGDSRFSTDYPFNRSELIKITSASDIYNGGFSGHNVAQNASNGELNRIISYDGDFVITLLGGNDDGASGTIGTFSNTSELSDLGESVVSETDINVDYSGTKFIQAVSHIMRRMKAEYYNFQERANLTGSETESEKEAKIDTVKKPVFLFLTDIPQKRYSNTNSYSLPENWNRKRLAVLECAEKYGFPVFDLQKVLLSEWDWDLEPFWTPPTDKNSNNGIYTMDGLHPNKYGHMFIDHIIKSELEKLGGASL